MAGGSRLMTLKKAADELGCHVETLRRAIRSKELLVTRHPTLPGHPYMVSASDLAQFVERRRVS
jgi:excisionase family DNA binding protein